jgi:hypothetical protein
MKQLYFLLFLSLLMNSCSNTSESSKGQAAVPLSVQAISFENEQVLENDKFHVKYPGSWKPGTAGKAKTEFVLNAPLIPNGDLSKESVHLMKMTLDQYQKEIYEFEILGSANNEFTFLGGPLENKAKYRHRFIEKDGVIYILGYSAGLKDWSTYEITADKIMRTFYLK